MRAVPRVRVGLAQVDRVHGVRARGCRLVVGSDGMPHETNTFQAATRDLLPARRGHQSRRRKDGGAREGRPRFPGGRAPHARGELIC